LLVAHRAVARAEVHGALEHLADAATAPDRLIVDLDSRLLVVGVEPLRVDRVGERRTGAVDQAAGEGGGGVKHERGDEQSEGFLPHKSSLGLTRTLPADCYDPVTAE